MCQKILENFLLKFQKLKGSESDMTSKFEEMRTCLFLLGHSVKADMLLVRKKNCCRAINEEAEGQKNMKRREKIVKIGTRRERKREEI